MSIIHLEDVRKTYAVKPPTEVLKGVNLDVEYGERIAIIGYSGAGKSTLLNNIGLLDEPSSGTYELAGKVMKGLSGRRKDRLRAENLGFVFQDYHVLGHRTVTENLELKLAINATPVEQADRVVHLRDGRID